MGERFVRAVEAIYAAAPEPSLWPQALQAIAAAFGDVGALLVYGRDDGSFGAVESPSLVPLTRLEQINDEWAGGGMCRLAASLRLPSVKRGA
jgi:hypothetical protein